MSRLPILALALAGLCFCSALGVVFSKQLSRQSYGELSRIQVAISALDVQWAQLQIEESTLSEHGLIENFASEQLGMEYPGLDGSVMITR